MSGDRVRETDVYDGWVKEKRDVSRTIWDTAVSERSWESTKGGMVTGNTPLQHWNIGPAINSDALCGRRRGLPI